MDLVSIVVPVYNSDVYLERGIKSLLTQTYNNIEVILVDDGSSDNSPAICDEYVKKDNRISVKHIPNGGVSNARNVGIEHVQGSYVMFMDSDDFYDPRTVEIMVEHTKDVQLAVARYCIYRKDKIEKIIGFDDNKRVTIREYLGYPFLGEETGFYCGTAANKIYDMNIIRDNNLRFCKEVTLCEDLLFNLNYIKYVENINIVSDNVYYYEQGNCGSLIKKDRPRGEVWRCKNVIYNQYIDTYTCFGAFKEFEKDISNFYMGMVVQEINEMMEREPKSSNVKMGLMVRAFVDDNNIMEVARKSNSNIRMVKFTTICILKEKYIGLVAANRIKCKIKNSLFGMFKKVKR